MIVKQINNLKLRRDADGLYRVVTPSHVVLEEFGQRGNAEAFMRRTLDYVRRAANGKSAGLDA